MARQTMVIVEIALPPAGAGAGAPSGPGCWSDGTKLYLVLMAVSEALTFGASGGWSPPVPGGAPAAGEAVTNCSIQTPVGAFHLFEVTNSVRSKIRFNSGS